MEKGRHLEMIKSFLSQNGGSVSKNTLFVINELIKKSESLTKPVCILITSKFEDVVIKISGDFEDLTSLLNNNVFVTFTGDMMNTENLKKFFETSFFVSGPGCENNSYHEQTADGKRFKAKFWLCPNGKENTAEVSDVMLAEA